MTGVIYSAQDIRRHASANAFRQGELYQASGEVMSFARAGNTIQSTVQGSERKPYRQTIQLTGDSGRVLVTGQCTCPVGLNCKHVVAALLHGLKTHPPPPPPHEQIVRRSVDRLLGTTQSQPDATASSLALPQDVLAWLHDLDLSRKTALEDYPPTIAQRIIYLFAPVEQARRFAQIGVTPISVRLLKDGRFSEGAKPFKLQASPHAVPPQFLRPSDIRILRALERTRQDYGATAFALGRDDTGPILLDMLATGRARWPACPVP